MVRQTIFKGADHLLKCANETSKNLPDSLKEVGNHVLCDPDSMALLLKSPKSTGSPRFVSFLNKLLPPAVSGC